MPLGKRLTAVVCIGHVITFLGSAIECTKSYPWFCHLHCHSSSKNGFQFYMPYKCGSWMTTVAVSGVLFLWVEILHRVLEYVYF
jgi:hypothetical protein